MLEFCFLFGDVTAQHLKPCYFTRSVRLRNAIIFG